MTMVEALARFSLVFSTLLVIVDPVGVVPTFLGLTKGFTTHEVRRTVLKAAVAGAVVLLSFSLFGTYLFRFLAIDLNAFRAGGGLLLLLTALEMLRGKGNERKCSPTELSSVAEREDISFVPIAVPLLAGPGAITSIMVFSTDHQAEHAINFSIIAMAVLASFLISYVVLRASSFLTKALGQSGVSVVKRLMGLILAALSIQLIAEGAIALVKTAGL